jgi:hypothetical protein
MVHVEAFMRLVATSKQPFGLDVSALRHSFSRSSSSDFGTENTCDAVSRISAWDRACPVLVQERDVV